jgi:hypothetical protein
VAAATTPGIASAFETSTRISLAWATFDRRILQCSILGRKMSSAKLRLPFDLRRRVHLGVRPADDPGLHESHREEV